MPTSRGRCIGTKGTLCDVNECFEEKREGSDEFSVVGCLEKKFLVYPPRLAPKAAQSERLKVGETME